MNIREASSHSSTHLIHNVHVLCYSRYAAAAMAAKPRELQNQVIHNERERDQRQVLVGPRRPGQGEDLVGHSNVYGRDAPRKPTAISLYSRERIS